MSDKKRANAAISRLYIAYIFEQTRPNLSERGGVLHHFIGYSMYSSSCAGHRDSDGMNKGRKMKHGLFFMRAHFLESDFNYIMVISGKACGFSVPNNDGALALAMRFSGFSSRSSQGCNCGDGIRRIGLP